MILGLNVVIYRRRLSRELKPCGKIHVCEDCLLRAAQPGETSRVIAESLLGLVVSRYSAILSEDAQ
jgi:hypothetical protein